MLPDCRSVARHGDAHPNTNEERQKPLKPRGGDGRSNASRVSHTTAPSLRPAPQICGLRYLMP